MRFTFAAAAATSALLATAAHAADLPAVTADRANELVFLACYDRYDVPYYVYVTVDGLVIRTRFYDTLCPGEGPDYVCTPQNSPEGYGPYKLTARHSDEQMTLVRADGLVIELVPCGTSKWP